MSVRARRRCHSAVERVRYQSSKFSPRGPAKCCAPHADSAQSGQRVKAHLWASKGFRMECGDSSNMWSQAHEESQAHCSVLRSQNPKLRGGEGSNSARMMLKARNACDFPLSELPFDYCRWVVRLYYHMLKRSRVSTFQKHTIKCMHLTMAHTQTHADTIRVTLSPKHLDQEHTTSEQHP